VSRLTWCFSSIYVYMHTYIYIDCVSLDVVFLVSIGIGGCKLLGELVAAGVI